MVLCFPQKPLRQSHCIVLCTSILIIYTIKCRLNIHSYVCYIVFNCYFFSHRVWVLIERMCVHESVTLIKYSIFPWNHICSLSSLFATCLHARSLSAPTHILYAPLSTVRPFTICVFAIQTPSLKWKICENYLFEQIDTHT